MRDITTQGRWLFWAFLIAVFLLSVVPSVVLIEKTGEYYRFLTGWDRTALRQLKVSHVPHREGGKPDDSPEIHYVEFELSAPKAKTVAVAGTFNQWQSLSLRREGEGAWRVLLPLPGGTYYYAFEVDGVWTLDPNPKAPQAAQLAGRECSVRQVP